MWLYLGPFEQEGLVDILGGCFGSDGDSIAHRGRDLPRGDRAVMDDPQSRVVLDPAGC